MLKLLLPLLATSASDALANETCPSQGADLSRFFGDAIEAFDRMDLAAFERTRDEARTALGCLEGIVAPKQAAAYHRIEALSAFAAQSEADAFASFRRAHELDPEYDLPERIAPAGHPLRVQFDRASGESPSPQDPLNLTDVDTWVDGRGTGLRPREVPAILQVRREGVVTYSGYLQPGMGVPTDATRKTRVTRVTEPKETRTRQAHGTQGPSGPFPTRQVVAGGGAALALAGGVAFLGNSLATRGEFRDTGTPYEDLDTLKRRANRQFFGFEVLSLTAIGLGTVAILPETSLPAWVP